MGGFLNPKRVVDKNSNNANYEQRKKFITTQVGCISKNNNTDNSSQPFLSILKVVTK